MQIFYLSVQLVLPFSHSLKEKRMVVQSLKKRIKNHFNVSIAETGDHDHWQYAELGMVGITTSCAQSDETTGHLIQWLDVHCEGEVIVLENTYL